MEMNYENLERAHNRVVLPFGLDGEKDEVTTVLDIYESESGAFTRGVTAEGLDYFYSVIMHTPFLTYEDVVRLSWKTQAPDNY